MLNIKQKNQSVFIVTKFSDANDCNMAQLTSLEAQCASSDNAG